jgi:Integrase core domain
LTDNGRQFTARSGRGGEVLFDRICRDNGIVHRLTRPASPTTTGKVERFHQTLRRDLLADHSSFADLEDVQAALDHWVACDYNTRRPHRSLDMATPADRFAPVPDVERDALPLRLPAALVAAPAPPQPKELESEPVLRVPALVPGAVEFERVVPASGNLAVAGKQFWLGPDRAGITVTCRPRRHPPVIAGARIKSVRSHLSSADLERLAATGSRPAGPPPLPRPDTEGAAIEVDRTVSAAGTVGLGGRVILAAEILGGRRVTIRTEGTTLAFFDPETRELLRTRAQPLHLRPGHPVPRRPPGRAPAPPLGRRRRRPHRRPHHHPDCPQHPTHAAPQGRPIKPRPTVAHHLEPKRQASGEAGHTRFARLRSNRVAKWLHAENDKRVSPKRHPF